jgi:hypothetical protein
MGTNLDANLKERIDLLHQTNQIDDYVYGQLPVLLKRVEDYLQITLSEENAGPFVSHLAIALQRILQKTPVLEVSDELKALTEKYPDYYQFAADILALPGTESVTCNAEASFVTLYLCLLSGKE